MIFVAFVRRSITFRCHDYFKPIIPTSRALSGVPFRSGEFTTDMIGVAALIRSGQLEGIVHINSVSKTVMPYIELSRKLAR